MKKFLFILALSAIGVVRPGFAQDSTAVQPSLLLHTYFQLKDALVSSNAIAAKARAGELLEAINDKTAAIPESTRKSLLKDAAAISQSGDLILQRGRFLALSDTMIAFAKTTELSTDPVYQQYCPMKKASWLSPDKAIKNPYYGSAMLTCGNIKATL